MGIKKEVQLYGGGKNKTIPLSVVENANEFIPLASMRRSSVPDSVHTFAPINKLSEIPPDFSVEYLTTLENMAAYNDYISYAVDNVVQLANTPHDITFPESISDKQANEMRLLLQTNEVDWYENSGGISSMKADLYAQLCINGALSAEHIPDKKLEKIEKVVRVAPKYIVFIYNRTKDKYEPHQKSALHFVKSSKSGHVKLNTKTYKYIALRRFFQSPYGVPPFISAIDSLCTQKGMDESFKNIMQKLGMLGFLSASVQPPKRHKGEKDGPYWERSIKYLSDVVYPQVEQNLSRGFVAGYKDKHEFKLEGNNMNVQGAEGLARLIKQRIFAGVKQDPNMLGTNDATTETFGRVILAKMLSQTTDYQRIVDRFFESLYLMELRLHGYTLDYVKVKSEKPLVSDQVKEQEAEGKKIENVTKKRDEGYISHEMAAQELDYDEAAGEQPIKNQPDPTNNDSKGDKKTDPSGGGDNSETTEENSALIRRLLLKYHHVPQYPYELISEGCFAADTMDFINISNFHDKKLQKLLKRYFKGVYGQHKKAVKKIASTTAKALANMPENAPLQSVQERVYLELLTSWDNEFSVAMEAVVENNIYEIWETFRKDTRIFGDDVKVESNIKKYTKGESFETVVPEGVLDLDDFRAISFIEQNDILYLGKYIQDSDVRNKVYQYIADNYIEGYLPLGNKTENINRFEKSFEKEMNLVGWKIRRIIDTSVNKIRNYSHVFYLDQAGVTNYEVVEVLDQLTCPYCHHMDGKKFAVSNTREKIEKEFGGDVANVSPFLTEMKIGEVEKLTAAQLQSKGYNAPPYHPHCRGTIVADLEE